MSLLSGALALAPGPGAPVTVGAVSTAAIDIGAHVSRVLVSIDQPAHLRFGESDVGAATTDDVEFPAGLYLFAVIPGRRYMRAIRATATDAALSWAAAS